MDLWISEAIFDEQGAGGEFNEGTTEPLRFFSERYGGGRCILGTHAYVMSHTRGMISSILLVDLPDMSR